MSYYIAGRFGWGRSSVGRAPQWHCGGQGFESPRLHQPKRNSFSPKGCHQTIDFIGQNAFFARRDALRILSELVGVDGELKTSFLGNRGKRIFVKTNVRHEHVYFGTECLLFPIAMRSLISRNWSGYVAGEDRARIMSQSRLLNLQEQMTDRSQYAVRLDSLADWQLHE